jgi:hypothetical protein
MALELPPKVGWLDAWFFCLGLGIGDWGVSMISIKVGSIGSGVRRDTEEDLYNNQ